MESPVTRKRCGIKNHKECWVTTFELHVIHMTTQDPPDPLEREASTGCRGFLGDKGTEVILVRPIFVHLYKLVFRTRKQIDGGRKRWSL